MSVPPESPRIARPWAWARAALVTLAIAFSVVSALPTRPISLDDLARPAFAHNVEGITGALSAVGIEVERAAVAQAIVEGSEKLLAARASVVTPLTPLLDFLGMGQRWGLFLQQGRTAFALEIDVQHPDGSFQLVYRPHEIDELALRSTLSFRRIRGIYNPRSQGAPRAQFEGFVSWIAARVLREHPSYRAVRARMQRLQLGSRSSPGRVIGVAHETVRTREPT